MLSAVENFSPPGAAATHAYARHHPFSIAAAAAAASTAAAAAAAIVPSQQQSQIHSALTIVPPHLLSHHSVLPGQLQHPLLSSAGIVLPSPGSSQPIPVPLSPLSPATGAISGTISTTQLQSIVATSVAVAMSSAEFARPHPKHPRYYTGNNNTSSNNSSNSNNNNNTNNNNNNTSSNNNNNNSSSSSNNNRHTNSPNNNSTNINHNLNINDNTNINNNNKINSVNYNSTANSNSGSNKNNNINISNTNNSSSSNSNNSTSINGIPLHLRTINNNNNNNNSNNSNNSNINNNNNNTNNSNNVGVCLNSSSPSRTKYSTSEQSGPVNLVTNNNSNNNKNNNTININNNNINNNNNNNNKNNNSNLNLHHTNNNNNNSNHNTSNIININHNNNNSNNQNNSSNNNNSGNNINSTSSPSPKDNTIPITIGPLNGNITNSQQPIGSHEVDVMAGLYAQKLHFSPSYHYTSLYGRHIYGAPAIYPGQLPISNRSQLNSRLPYIAPHDQFPPYLSSLPVAYSTPSIQGAHPPPGLLGPPPTPPGQSIGLSNSVHTTANLLSNSGHSGPNTSATIKQISTLSERQHSTSLHHIQSSLPPPSTERSPHHLPIKDKDSKNSVYLNGKVNSSSAAHTNINVTGFKVPSGKEGSLKHRILTRPPYSEKEVRRRSPIMATAIRASSNNSAPTNFSKGSLIELANGDLRRVEDMRTEDFIHSAEKNTHLQLADSTVVKITNTLNNVIITFSYNKNRSKVDMTASLEHPFFVYGQGWASCNPELSMQVFGLKCQRLQVGDVCISLIPREQGHVTPVLPSPPSSVHYKDRDDVSPQNLSRKSVGGNLASTVPTTATSTAVSSRLTTPQTTHLSLPPQSTSGHYPVQHYEIMRPYETSPPALQRHQSPPGQLVAITNGLPYPQPQHALSLTHQHPQAPLHLPQPHPPQHRPQPHIIISDAHFQNSRTSLTADIRGSPPPSHSAPNSRPPSNQVYYLGVPDNQGPSSLESSPNAATNFSTDSTSRLSESEQQAAATEATLSRKRRWSAPDNICDDDDCQPTPHKIINNS